jgi:hypothetical protein
MNKYPKSEQNHIEQFDAPAYISMDGTAANRAKGFAEWNKAVDEFGAIEHTAGSLYYQDYSNLDNETSGRPGLSKSDYYKFRPGEAPPSKKDFKRVIHRCDEVYQKVGLIRNIIDLMGDFACQGIKIVHQNKKIEKFGKNWALKTNFAERSERFCNNLIRTGNVIVRKSTAKITAKTEEILYRSLAEADMEITFPKTVSREIPFKYVFLDPTTIDVVGGPLSTFVGQPLYTITLPTALKQIISSPKTDAERMIISKLPVDIINAAKNSRPYVLPMDKTRVFHYKKDDWQTWASPMIYSVLDDIMVLEKLRLADMAALDGAISNIRIFKLGNLEYKIAPSRAAAAKLSRILQNNVGGGTIDLIWGPDIELLESKTTVHQFLGSEKYKPHLDAVYIGLGIPPTLTGLGGTGTTNNYISLKTLLQRLNYVRSVLLSFWNQELAEVQKAMGFRFPFKVEFDIDILDDAQTIRSLLIQLSDRNLISDELLQTRFGHDPDMEEIRIKHNQKDRENGKKPAKAGPFYDPLFGTALKKIALQTGALTPGQVGLRPDADSFDMLTKERLAGEKTSVEMRTPVGIGGVPAKPKGVPQQGRPKNSTDKIKRKTKTFKPKSQASLDIWVKNTQAQINDTINNTFLEMVHKKDMRHLTNAEAKQAEKLKFGVLFNIDPLSTITEQAIYKALGARIDSNLYKTYQTWITDISTELDRPLTFDELKQIQITLYSKAINNE